MRWKKTAELLVVGLEAISFFLEGVAASGADPSSLGPPRSRLR
jgi:hypothetical protein